MKQLNTLKEPDMKTVVYAVWLANTDESKQYLKSIGATRALENQPPDILQTPIDNVSTMDSLWAYFFATGSEAPIRKVITAFNGGEHAGAFKAYQTAIKTGKETEQGKINSLQDIVFFSASLTLESYIKTHARVAEICGDIFENGKLSALEKLWLGKALNKAFPNKYKITESESVQGSN